MENKSRVSLSLKNSTVGFVTQIVNMLATFTIQTVFIKTLGAQYIGANGLFSNLLSFLSFAELGVGSAITFSLYEPLAKKDEWRISAVMNLFKKSYNYIGIAILIMGSILSFFVPFMINKNSNIPHVQFMFILYLLNSGISYFFTYKRTLLVANQQGYLDTINRMVFAIIQTIAQVYFIITTKAYISYLIIQVLCTFASNLSISRKTDKLYPFLKKNTEAKLDKKTRKILGKNVVGAIASKLGTIVAYGTDNILLSKFIGLVIVGSYSNYMLILTSIQNISNQVLNACVSSIANFANTESSEREAEIFYDYMYLVSGVTFILSVSVFAVFQGFIRMWAGPSYLLSEWTVFLLVLNWTINLMRSSILSFMSVHGLYWDSKWKSVIESLVNLLVGIVLISFFKLGVQSVILGTLASNIFVNMWWEPYIIIGKNIKTSFSKYYRKYFTYLFLNIVALISIYLLFEKNLINFNNMIGFLKLGILFFFGSTMIFILLTIRSREFKFYFQILKRLVGNRFLKDKSK